MRTSNRTIIRKIHLCIGLSLGLFFSFLGLTGGLLVFEHEIDEWLNPKLLLSAENKDRPDLDKVLAAAVNYNRSFKVQRLETPRSDTGVYLVRGIHTVNSESRPVTIYVDPRTLMATGSRVWGEYPMSFIYKLHYTLLMGNQGSTVVGIAGVLLLFMVITGVILWWPKKGKWKQAIGVKWRAKRIRVIWDLHRSLGFFFSFLLAVVTISGIYMIFPVYVKPMISWVSPITQASIGLKSNPNHGLPTISPEQASYIAGSTFPNLELKRIYFPEGEEGVYRVVKRERNSVIKSSGYFQVWIEQYNGKVLATRSPDNFSGGDYFSALQFPLHNGEAFGLPGRLMILITSLMPTVLLTTGFLIWKRKRTQNLRKT